MIQSVFGSVGMDSTKEMGLGCFSGLPKLDYVSKLDLGNIDQIIPCRIF